MLLSQNSKLRKTSKEIGAKVVNFGIPAYKSSSGKITCPYALTCVKGCYAKKGAYIWSNVKPAFERRYQASLKDDFVPVMCEAIIKSRARYVRIHDSGDFYSPAYLEKWLQIMKLNPDVRFYAYTKSVPFFKENGTKGGETISLPENFSITFSIGGKYDHLIDMNKDRHAVIFDTKEELDAAGYVDASKNDMGCAKWFNPSNKVGLIWH
jgi:hypothetical protein